jgi:hypothetical protein
VEKIQFWNGCGCGEKLLSPPPACVLGVGDFNEIVCGRKCLWVQRVVYVGKSFQWAMGGGGLYFGSLGRGTRLWSDQTPIQFIFPEEGRSGALLSTPALSHV